MKILKNIVIFNQQIPFFDRIKKLYLFRYLETKKIIYFKKKFNLELYLFNLELYLFNLELKLFNIFLLINSFFNSKPNIWAGKFIVFFLGD